MPDLLEQLDAQIKDAEERFAAIQKEEISLKEQRAELDRQISAKVEEEIRLQGEYRALKKLKGEPQEPPAERPN